MLILAGMIGIAIGLLINPAKTKVEESLPEIKNALSLKQGAKFFEPVSFKEKWEKSKNINDLL